MSEEQPDPLKLRSIKLDFEKQRIQIELTDATALRFDFTPQGILAEWLQPPTITTARAVDRLVEAAEAQTEPEPAATAEGKEKPTVYTFTGRIKGQVREGRADPQGKKTAWGNFAVHEEGNDEARMLLADFRRHTANIALSLPANAQITAQGYIRPSDTPGRKDSYYIFQILDHPGKRQEETST